MTSGVQAEIITFLSDPACLAQGPIEQIETHGSIVFLAGDRAYKLKKAVRFSYLNYSTLALREAACRRELTINARFAPSLYLAVTPITREADGRLALDGGGDPVDWLVVMRRFPQADQLDRVAEQGLLTPSLLRALADQIATAHDQALPDLTFGGPDAFHPIHAATLTDLLSYAGHDLDPVEVAQWGKAAADALTGLALLLERRRRGGHVRAAHGDLHLANICLIDQVPTLFDAIEFDPALSTIDLLYDLAFLLMDLEARGLRDAANLVFNRYLDLRDESDGLEALPFFMSLRAAIRAQVLFAATLNATDSHEHATKRGQAKSYLRLALDLLRPASPRLIAIGGFSGTGKSTLAQTLAPQIGAAPGARVLRSDVLRKRVFGVPPETRLPAEGYSADAHIRTYTLLYTQAGQCLKAGRSVIADAVFGGVEERDAIRATAEAVAAPFDAVWLTAPVSALEQRVTARVGDASDATVSVVHHQINRTQAVPEWQEIDAGQGADMTLASVIGVLNG